MGEMLRQVTLGLCFLSCGMLTITITIVMYTICGGTMGVKVFVSLAGLPSSIVLGPLVKGSH